MNDKSKEAKVVDLQKWIKAQEEKKRGALLKKILERGNPLK